jgi:tRNA nucleotidyltransferase (CCA-adding enzyme)
MTSLSRVLREAESIAVPSEDDESTIHSKANRILARTKKAAARFSETRGVLLGGSFAKGTWLKGHVDLDIFVKFDAVTPEADFERIGLDIGALATRGFPRGKKFAQHPYTEADVDGVRVNIVPCFDVAKGEWKSAADRSPFHVKLIEKLSQEGKAQVRLLKLFMNGIGVYGAEIEKQGFSGYVAEVLVMKHGDFRSVLEWFADSLSGSTRLFSLPDPVDEKRDLGIAVSGGSYGRMVLASREFLKHPSLAFFGEMPGRARPSMKEEVVAVVFNHKQLSEDTLWGELRRTTKHIVRHLEVLGFVTARSMAASNNLDRSALLIIPEYAQLPEREQRVGPTVDRRKDVEAFMNTNAKSSRLIWVDDDARVRLLRPRKYTILSHALADVVRGRAGPIGASKELEAGMRRSAKILQGARLRSEAKSARWLSDGIREITSDAIGAH